jgi:N-acetylglucosaminyldiphosphoundecaprenol N-acetyl-beta-D-mannosaminyltransferase
MSPASQVERVRILGVPIDRVTMAETLDRLDDFVRSGQPHFVITADAAGIVQSQSDPELKALYEQADLVTPDSAGVLWAAERQGRRLGERVSGVEIVERVAARSAERAYRIFFLGAAPGVAQAAADRLCQKYPGCQIVGTRDGYFPGAADADVAAEVAETNPDFLFVAMGIPRQEKFILATKAIIRARVAMGVGGTFDVLSGHVKRAPRWMQRLRTEWLWRVIQNPKKAGKVMMLPTFVRLVLKDKS